MARRQRDVAKLGLRRLLWEQEIARSNRAVPTTAPPRRSNPGSGADDVQEVGNSTENTGPSASGSSEPL